MIELEEISDDDDDDSESARERARRRKMITRVSTSNIQDRKHLLATHTNTVAAANQSPRNNQTGTRGTNNLKNSPSGMALDGTALADQRRGAENNAVSDVTIEEHNEDAGRINRQLEATAISRKYQAQLERQAPAIEFVGE